MSSPGRCAGRSWWTTTSTGPRAPNATPPGRLGATSFYLYFGEGLGGAIISDGNVRRGHGGIAGEIAHVITASPDGTAMRFLDVFGALGLRHPGSTAIDVGALNAAIGDGNTDGTAGGAVLGALARAIGGVLSSVVALCDPELVVLGGPWAAGPQSSTPCAPPLSVSGSRSRCELPS